MSPSSSISTKTDFQSASEAPQAQDSHSTAASLHVGKRSLSWPGSLPCSQEKIPTCSDSFKPITAAPSMSDKASLRAQTVISSLTQPAPVSLQATSPLSQIPVGTPFIYQLAPSQGLGLRQPMLTPILTMLPPGLVSPVLTPPMSAPVPPAILNPASGLSMPLVAPPPTNVKTPEKEPSKPQNISLVAVPPPHPKMVAEPTTGQAIVSSPSEAAQGHFPRQSSPVRTLASISSAEMTPHYTELKNFAEEFKTRRIRLGFTQGAVGQSLADKGYNNFAQSTISRFEQMQLSPTNATAIKQVLEKWLQDTENPMSAQSTTHPSSSNPVMANRKRKKRAVFTPHTRASMEEFFKQNPRPNRQLIEAISQQLDLLPEEVRVWFCNKRQKQKQQQSTHYHFDRETSHSTTSSGSNSPSSLFTTTFFQSRPKRSTPSPKTSFTIEELSKSSTGSTSASPVQFTSPFSSPPSCNTTASGHSMFPILLPPGGMGLSPVSQFMSLSPPAVTQTTAWYETATK